MVHPEISLQRIGRAASKTLEGSPCSTTSPKYIKITGSASRFASRKIWVTAIRIIFLCSTVEIAIWYHPERMAASTAAAKE
jgi:hypothetical protein